MVKLYIMRHGQAEMAAPSDAQRSLSEAGRAEVRRIAESLKGIPFDGILCSPYVRARQTADIVAEVIQGPERTVSDCFTPDDSPVTALENLPEEGCWLLVAHMPLVASLAGLLVEGKAHAGPGFSTAMIVELELDYPAAGMAHHRRTLTPAR